ncbi:unnamed protein product [Lupinus luteus]|uniref:Uncharacterized protein n=1 Tax=Lupinus luteus TaxID=3873 RepID=A0AAV1Y2S3_LUPLU
MRASFPKSTIFEKDPLLWRVTTLVSSIVGFACFSKSTIFEDLFGLSNPMKIVIYFSVLASILTVTIYTMIRAPHMMELKFTKKWWFKAQMSFVVLIIPFFHFFGKEEREEVVHKDELKVFGRLMDLLTTGAFSIAAVSMSRELWLGIGTNIFNSFLGVLLVLGVKLCSMIGLELAFLLCYLLIMIRFYVEDHCNNNNNSNNSSLRAPENIETGNIIIGDTSTHADYRNESIRQRGYGLIDYTSHGDLDGLIDYESYEGEYEIEYKYLLLE